MNNRAGVLEGIADAVLVRRGCQDCGGHGWTFLERGDAETNNPSPCPTCKPYGPRQLCASAFPRGARVTHRYTSRVGTVLRSWKRFKDCYEYCDLRYDDGAPGVAWDGDLVPYVPEPALAIVAGDEELDC